MNYAAQTSADEMDDALRIEAGGFSRVAQAALPHLRETGGCLVAVTSAALGRHVPKDLLSTAPKAAIEAIVRAIAREEGRHGVRANSVRVGVIDSGMFHHFAAEGGGIDTTWVETATRNIPLRRLGRAEEVAEAVGFLASTAASYITGQALSVDGGFDV